MTDTDAMKTAFTRARMFAEAMVYNIMRKRFKQGTPPKRHRHVHDRADGPNSRTSLHMLRRSVNMGYVWQPETQ